MLRSFSKGSKGSHNVTDVLSRLRGSFTQQDNPSTDRVREVRKRYNSTMAQTYAGLPLVANNPQKKRKSCAKEGRANSLKGLLKTSSGSTTLRNSRKSLKTSNAKSILEEEFRECVARLDHRKHTHIGKDQCFLDYRCFIYVMSELNYLSNWRQDNSLMDQMWKELGGEDYGGFLRSNLLLFLEIVEGVSDIDTRVKVMDVGAQQSTQKKQKKNAIFIKYERLRMSRIEYKGMSATLHSNSQLKIQREQQNDGNLKKLRKSLITKDQNRPRMAVKLKRRPQSKQALNNSGKSYRISLQLDVGARSSKKRAQNREDEENIQKTGMEEVDPTKLHKQSLLFEDQQSQGESASTLEFLQTRLQHQRLALLSLDINLGEGKSDKIIIYEGDTPRKVAQSLTLKHNLNKEVCGKFQKILESHLHHVLSKIEEVEELTEDLCGSQRQI